MWKILYQLSSPKIFYQKTGHWIKWLSIAAFAALLIGFVWGLGFAPSDYQQGDAFRIIYIHVPCAIFSISIYAFMGFLSVLVLIWNFKIAGIVLEVSAKVGASMAFLALVTGSIWGKPMWGTWWIWDARLTSELILLILYAAVIATSHAYQHKEQGAKVVAILTMVGLVDLPIIHYSVYWWNTLHQGATLSLFSKPKIHTSMLYPLLISIIGFGLYCVFIIISKTRNELLIRERRQSWVKTLVEGGTT